MRSTPYTWDSVRKLVLYGNGVTRVPNVQAVMAWAVVRDHA
jgi:hypothetical protein